MKSLFREQVLNQQTSRMQGEVSLVQVPAFYWLTGLILFVVVCSFIFLLSGSYARKTVVFGVLQPEQGVIRIQTSQAGTVQKLLVKEGEKVKAGQPLIELTMQHFSSEQTELNASLKKELGAILSNLQRQKQQEIASQRIREQDIIERNVSAQLQLNQVLQQQATFQQRLELNQRLVKQVSQLSGTGFISNLELSRQQDTLLALQQQEQVLQGQRLTLEEQLKQQQSLQKQLPIDHQATVAQLDNQISELRNQLTRLQHEQSSMIRAPKAGTISGILPGPGYFINAGSIVLSLLPEGAELEAIVYVPTSAVAFIEPGQDVRLRFHAFPYERFGVQLGRVNEVSHTVLMPEEVADITLQEPSYRVRVQLSSQQIQAYNRELPLRAGMTLDGDVITERRSLLQWLFDPIYSIKGQM
ncbi:MULTISPECIES: HlyD family efflux transporter periplasmic adaptor subunit [unclassified Arsukibacterium]|uniref:HlyD family efflux transporter periplasmic adaptor subunit n=1 Tax=unclassified Arsukibacterium TaxID=2635278 RepID=UPI000C538621|nr:MULTISPECIES: HlyD family efflux transporter periplasmic adaptor subunit [unclassified Arsukibacterium]MAA95938.1 toxin [Rheinheimera sp.]MBM34758.1 toxin [Rheinheimera sp.]HAW91657.1 toxin [Candidatus Azambacteria bacterium]|tara:strand:+ start:1618 stop:2859 length:1242 start_codon:yes stop_codon:yes gene_type:complete